MIGKPKRRSGAAYGIFLGWLGVLIVAVLPAVPAQVVPVQPNLALATRECPFCKEPMRRDASVCPHCRHDSEPWVFEGGRWRAKVGEAWDQFVEATREWVPLAESAAKA